MRFSNGGGRRLACTVLAVMAGGGVGLSAGSATGQTTQPTTAPATVDASTPKAAVKAFVTAQINGDGRAIREGLIATSPTEQRLAGAIADLAVAIADLDRAMVAKFGAAQTVPLMGDPADAMRANLEKLDKATAKVTGDTATVTSSADPAPGAAGPGPGGEGSPQDSMSLRRVDGRWKVSVSDLAKGRSSTDVETTLTSIDTAVAAYRSVLDDLNGGKLTSVDAVASALDTKLAPAKAAAGATTAPVSPVLPTK